MVIFDKEKQKIMEYRSTMAFNFSVVEHLMNPKILTQLKHNFTCGENLTGKKLADLGSEFGNSADDNTSMDL